MAPGARLILATLAMRQASKYLPHGLYTLTGDRVHLQVAAIGWKNTPYDLFGMSTVQTNGGRDMAKLEPLHLGRKCFLRQFSGSGTMHFRPKDLVMGGGI